MKTAWYWGRETFFNLKLITLNDINSKNEQEVESCHNARNCFCGSKPKERIERSQDWVRGVSVLNSSAGAGSCTAGSEHLLPGEFSFQNPHQVAHDSLKL